MFAKNRRFSDRSDGYRDETGGLPSSLWRPTMVLLQHGYVLAMLQWLRVHEMSK